MKKFYILASALLATMTLSMSCSGVVEDKYVVLASSAVQQDAEWMKVAETITQKHDADLVFYDKAPREVLAQLPMECAVEAQKLLSLSLEGSVG